jgi:hypothetical protein
MKVIALNGLNKVKKELLLVENQTVIGVDLDGEEDTAILYTSMQSKKLNQNWFQIRCSNRISF